MRILGIDPASERCGYGVIDAVGTAISYVEAGVLKAPADWDKYRRLAEIQRDLEQLLDEQRPGAVALEAGFVGPVKGFIMQGTLVSAAARGVCGAAAARRGLYVVEYAPSTVKKAATGSGRADKAQVAKLVAVRLGLARAPESDAADALAIAICHAQHLAGVSKLSKRAA